MKKLKAISIFVFTALICVLSLAAVPLSKADAKAQTQNYLFAPTQLAVANDSYYIYDDFHRTIKVYSSLDANAGTAYQKEFDISGAEILSMCLNENDLIFKQTKNGTPSFEKIDLTSGTQTTLTYTLNLARAKKIFANGGYLYVSTETSIHKLLLSGNTLTHQKSIDLAETESLKYSQISDFTISGDTLIILTADGQIWSLSGTNYPYTETQVSAPTGTPIMISGGTGSFVTLFKNNDQTYLHYGSGLLSQISLGDSNYSALTTSGNYVYLCSTGDQNVKKVNLTTGEVTLALQNQSTPVSPTQKVEYTAQGDTPLYASEFATQSAITITSGSAYLLLAPTNAVTDHLYVLYTKDGINHLGYIKKPNSDSKNTKTQTSQKVKTIGDSTKLYTYPTTAEDEQNQATTVPILTELKQVYTETYTNGDGETFYLVKHNDNELFVQTKSVVKANKTQTEKLKCNARIKRDTIVYADADATEFLLLAKKGSRIIIDDGKLESKNDYTGITYQLADGTVVHGYVKTMDIKADSLSTLQTIGIALISVNIILLIVLAITLTKFKKKNKV